MRLGTYSVRERLYEGKHSRVYRATRAQDGAPVVLKILNQFLPDPRQVARFRREYELLKELRALAVPQVYSLDELDDTLMMVMEDRGAVSLDRLDTRDWSLAESLELAVRITEVVDKIHQFRVIHKDINTSNIVVEGPDRAVRLIDFGLSSVLAQERATPVPVQALEGTLPYIAPEQTGRLNREIDERSDLYSLGATLFELLSGRPPFEGGDAMELIHAHLAKTPPALSDLRATVPEPLSDIVSQLLQKNPEDRYQSARGVLADLTECWNRVRRQQPLDDLRIGRADVASHLVIPHRVYGREHEVARLLEAFARANSGAAEVVIVGGASGVGKSALIHEIRKPVALGNGRFVTGKFDELQRNIPYSALISAFAGLIEEVLGEREAEIARWREVILSRVGGTTKVIVDLLPTLTHVVGPLPDVIPLGPAEARNRLFVSFAQFVGALVEASGCLALFIDDLQWADRASLELLEVVALDPSCRGWMLVGAYRDNEVRDGHPLVALLAKMRAAGCQVTELTVPPLSSDSLTELVADTFAWPGDQAASFAELCLDRTAGNPFFVEQFLLELTRKGAVWFDGDAG
jgi:tRNA A-37 threonylcarbamoyl transferase component Bud32